MPPPPSSQPLQQPRFLPVCPPVCLPVCPFSCIGLFPCTATYQFALLLVWPLVYVHTSCLPACLSASLSACCLAVLLVCLFACLLAGFFEFRSTTVLAGSCARLLACILTVAVRYSLCADLLAYLVACPCGCVTAHMRSPLPSCFPRVSFSCLVDHLFLLS